MILLVEDDRVSIQITQAALQRLHLPSVAVETGAEALEKLETVPIDMLIVDLHLPDMLGLDLIEAIQTRPHLADLPIMCCTSDCYMPAVLRARTYGVTNFLVKPIKILDFSKRVQEMLDARTSPRWESRERHLGRLKPHLTETVLKMVGTAIDQCIALLEEEADNSVLSLELVRLIGSAEQVGALRLASQIQRLWPHDKKSLVAALQIEKTAVSMKILQATTAWVTTPPGATKPDPDAWIPAEEWVS